MGVCNGNDTMLRRSDQLALVAENDHFEGSIDLKEDMMPKFFGFQNSFFQVLTCEFQDFAFSEDR